MNNQYASLLMAIAIMLSGCASQPERTTFADIAVKNESLKASKPVHIVKDIEADCDDAGMCELPEANLKALTAIITQLQTEVDARVESHNHLVDGLTHCEYANAKQDEAISYLEQSRDKAELVGQVRQFVTMLGCGALILAK